MRPGHRRTPTILLLALLAAPPARAAVPAAAPDTALYAVPPVTVRAARPTARAGGASALEAALDSSAVPPAPTLEQVLRGFPLVIVRANSRGEAQPALRGGEDRQVAVLVDGVPITLAWDHRSDLSVVPLTAARRVTVHRGLSSLLLGPNALAGAVEVDVARGPDRDAPPPPAALDLGMDHSGARSAALAGGLLREDATGRWVARAGAGYRGSDGLTLPHALESAAPAFRARLVGRGDRRLNTDVSGLDGFLTLRRAARGGAWASLTGAGYRVERGVAPEAHVAEPRLWRYPEQLRGLGALSGGTGERATPWGRGDLEASLGWDAGRTAIDEYDALDYANVSGGERDRDRTLTARMLGDHTLGPRGDLRAALTWADVRHDESLDRGPWDRYGQRLWSLASETEWRIGAGVPLRLGAGAAADGADTPRSGGKPALGRLWDWAGRLGATAALRDGALLVHASAARRARFPALRELYSGALGRFVPNPGLRPEVQRSGEAGITLRGGAAEVQLVGFHQRLDDPVVRTTVATPGGNKYLRVNLGRTTAVGAEAVAEVRSRGWGVGGGATLQRTRGEDGSGRETELEYEPAAHGKLWGEAPLPLGAKLGLELDGTGRQRYLDLDTGSFASLAPSLRLDLRLGRTFGMGAGPWDRAEALLSVENATDQVIWDQAGLPQPGRTVRLQVGLR